MGRLADWITGSSITGEDGQSWDDRSRALYQAGYRLIGARDFEAVSVAQIAEAAGCSVGAFYQRFENKDQFVGFVVRAHFEIIGDRVSDALDAERWGECSARDVAEAVADAMLEIAQGQGAGITRAAIKRCHAEDMQRAPVERYRAIVVDRSIALLVPLMGDGSTVARSRAVGQAVQIGQAVVFDALIHWRGILNLDNLISMRDALASMLMVMLRLEDADRPTEAADGHEIAGPSPVRKDVLGGEIEAVEVPEAAPSTRLQRAQRRRKRYFLSVGDVRDWMAD
jgi:AcrR family transcriptional regulator